MGEWCGRQTKRRWSMRGVIPAVISRREFRKLGSWEWSPVTSISETENMNVLYKWLTFLRRPANRRKSQLTRHKLEEWLQQTGRSCSHALHPALSWFTWPSRSPWTPSEEYSEDRKIEKCGISRQSEVVPRSSSRWARAELHNNVSHHLCSIPKKWTYTDRIEHESNHDTNTTETSRGYSLLRKKRDERAYSEANHNYGEKHSDIVSRIILQFICTTEN